MKILYVTTIGKTMDFFEDIVLAMTNKNILVDIATNENNGRTATNDFFHELGCKIYHLSCVRSPFKIDNLKAIREIKIIVRKGGYDIVHCHTPIASVCTRIACVSLRGKGLKVLYTAHGFHFYSGAPLKNWLLYFSVEWLCSWMTDILITINMEDYRRAKKHLHAKRTVYIPGVGVDIDKFSAGVDDRRRKEMRAEFGMLDSDIAVLSVGELNKNKNHQTVIYALSKLKNKKRSLRGRLHYFIAGTGSWEKRLLSVANKAGVKMHLLGYRKDVPDLMNMADVYVLPSLREGLNVSLMEAMAAGLPIVASKIRGNTDLIRDGYGGYLVDSKDATAYARAINMVLQNNSAGQMGEYNRMRIRYFNQTEVSYRLMNIYHSISSEQGKFEFGT